jgi:gas vesicle protein
MSRRDGDTALIALLSFVLGGIVGAGVALLMAPQEGKKTRKKIKELAEDVKEQTVEYAEKLKEKIS